VGAKTQNLILCMLLMACSAPDAVTPKLDSVETSKPDKTVSLIANCLRFQTGELCRLQNRDRATTSKIRSLFRTDETSDLDRLFTQYDFSNFNGDEGQSILHLVAYSKVDSETDRWVKNYRSLLFAQDDKGETSLRKALNVNSEAAVKAFLRAGYVSQESSNLGSYIGDQEFCRLVLVEDPTHSACLAFVKGFPD